MGKYLKIPRVKDNKKLRVKESQAFFSLKCDTFQ